MPNCSKQDGYAFVIVLGIFFMAENKKSVLLYCDIIHTVEELDDADAGLLFKHYLRYINDQNPEPPSKLIKIVFEPIRQNLKRDLKKWEQKSIKNSENAKLRWNKTDANYANGCERTKTDANYADKDTVTVKVTDTVTVTDINNNSHEQFLEKLLSDDFLGQKEAIEISCRVIVDRKLLEHFNANLNISNKNHTHWSEYLKHLRSWIHAKPPDGTIGHNGYYSGEKQSKLSQAIESHKGAEKLLDI